MRSVGEQFDTQAVIERLRLAKKSSDDVRGIEQPVEALSQETLARDRRAARLKDAGDIFPAAAALAVASTGVCPRVEGHAASERMAKAVEAFVRSRECLSLVLIAPAGRGKSWTAAWAIAESTERSMWLPADECRVGSSWDSLRERAAKVPLLVLDDLGEEAGGEWGAREMAVLLQSRHNKGARTIITTNLSPDQIGARYGERLISRWSEAPYSRVVGVTGEDLRKMGAAK